MKLLLAHGVATVAGSPETPLMAAIRYGHEQSMRFLLANEADVNASSALGNTPSHDDEPERLSILRRNARRGLLRGHWT